MRMGIPPLSFTTLTNCFRLVLITCERTDSFAAFFLVVVAVLDQEKVTADASG